MRLIAGVGLNYFAVMLLMAALQKPWPGIWDRVMVAIVVGGLFVLGGVCIGSWTAK